jgi:hypothetical protein
MPKRKTHASRPCEPAARIFDFIPLPLPPATLTLLIVTGYMARPEVVKSRFFDRD